MLEVQLIEAIGNKTIYSWGLQAQNLSDYLPSYLLMAVGIMMILTGILWGIKLYLNEKQEQEVEAAADLSRQIMETTQNARILPARIANVPFQPHLVSTADMNNMVPDYQINQDETVLMDNRLDATVTLGGLEISPEKKAKPGQDETVTLIDG
ncbi:MAG: hypothetical protein VB084_01750 [Syntrophomonadaceae bacterium]|nr:hypothetical protein [Syntrophomonadaceae bacterium]